MLALFQFACEPNKKGSLVSLDECQLDEEERASSREHQSDQRQQIATGHLPVLYGRVCITLRDFYQVDTIDGRGVGPVSLQSQE